MPNYYGLKHETDEHCYTVKLTCFINATSEEEAETFLMKKIGICGGFAISSHLTPEGDSE